MYNFKPQTPKPKIIPNYKPQNDKPFDIRERTFNFAKRILQIVDKLPKSPDCIVLVKQLVGSGTSIGANVEESDGTVTKKDFKNKLVIARKEAKETLYWLRLISGKYIDGNVLKEDIQECYELIKILSAMINKM